TGAHQQKGTHGAARPAQVGAGGEQVLVQAFNGGVLAFDVGLQVRRQVGDVLQLVGGHAVDRDAGPVGDDFGDLASVDAGVNQGFIGLKLGQFLLNGGGFAFQVRAFFLVGISHVSGSAFSRVFRKVSGQQLFTDL